MNKKLIDMDKTKQFEETEEEILKYIEEINNKYYQQLDDYSKGKINF